MCDRSVGKGAGAIGTSFGAPTGQEVELAELIAQVVPSMEMVRLVEFGHRKTTMSSAGYAWREDSRDATSPSSSKAAITATSIRCWSKPAPAWPRWASPIPSASPHPSPPPRSLCRSIPSPRWSRRSLRSISDKIAAVIVEPVAGNMGSIPAAPGFLEALRELTARHGALLIFDEVMTGFRVALGGAQARFGIHPDMTTIGKIIGGGLPMAAYGGRADIMKKVAPVGPIYQAGTLSGNPLAVAAGLAMLRYLVAHPEVYEILEARGVQLSASVPPGVTVNRVGSMFTFFFTPDPVTDWASAERSDKARFAKLFHFMLERGVYLAPSQFEAGFISAVHSEDDIRHTVDAMKAFFED